MRNVCRRIVPASGPWVLAAFAATVLAGCQSASIADKTLSDPITTASTGAPSMKETAAAGKKWRADPGNIRYGMAYARELEALGNQGERMTVLAEVAKRNPNDIKFQTYYGKQLVQAGHARKGEKVLRRVIKAGKADWKTYSALGSALDQQGRHKEARGYYGAALKAQPNKISILNNMGMSYMLEGDLKQAEATLRRAYGLPDGRDEPRIRQNLALAIGLQGRFEEAEKIASEDLDPKMVAANMAYLRKMLSQQNSWQKLKASDKG